MNEVRASPQGEKSWAKSSILLGMVPFPMQAVIPMAQKSLLKTFGIEMVGMERPTESNKKGTQCACRHVCFLRAALGMAMAWIGLMHLMEC